MLRLTAFALLALCACGARTGLDDDGITPDAGALDAAVDLCMRDGRPVVMGNPRTFRVSGLQSEGVLDGDVFRALVVGREGPAGTEVSLQRFTLDGPVGSPERLATVPGDRPWDSALARTGTGEVVLATVVGEDVELRVEGSTAGPQPLRLQGLYVNLAWSGARLAVTTTSGGFDECRVGWANTAGRWLAAMHPVTPANSPQAQIAGLGLPAMRRPAGFTAQGEAVYYALASDGAVRRLVSSRERESVSDLSIASPGPRYYHSFMSAMGAGVLGAMWIRTDLAASGTNTGNVVYLATMDDALRPHATPLTFAAPGQSYALRMDVAWCSGRFIAQWEDQNGVAVAQIDPSGRLLAEPIRYGNEGNAGFNHVRCMPGGAVVLRWGEATTLRCF